MLHKKISTKVIINASPQEVWSVLINFKSYPKWNSFILLIKGNLNLNNKLKVKIKPPQKSAMTFKPVITIISPTNKLQWKGKLLFPYIFDGKHTLELIDNNNGTTTFVQSEDFNGVLVPFFSKMINQHTRNGFNIMNTELKNRVENQEK